jgi:hypothetical protein
MRGINLLTVVTVAAMFAAPAFAQSGGGGSEGNSSAGSNQVHCGAANNANAAADPNCAQRQPPMPAPGTADAPRNAPSSQR